MKFDTVPDTINRGIAMVMYADPGVGKTTLAATLPEGETLIINTEAGLGPLLGTKHIVFNLLKSMKGYEIEAAVDELYKHLRTEKHPFKYVVVDNCSELEQQLILNLTLRRGKETPELREYGDVAFKMKEWVRSFRDLIYQNITVVFNAWEFPLDIKKDDGRVLTKTFPMIGKKIAPQVCGIVDVVGHLEIHEKSGKRWIRFGNSDQYITKSQFKGLDNAEPPDLPMILDKLYTYNYEKEAEDGNK